MAVDPATLKLIVTQAVKVVTDEEKRNQLILGIVILVVILVMIILVPLYLLTTPLESMKLLVKNENDIENIENMQITYGQNLQYGKLTYKGKFPFPLQQADKVVVTAEYGMYDPFGTGTLTKHTGLDISGVHHDNVLVIADGVVTWAGVKSRIW